jgi:ribosomal protein L10
MKLKDAGLPAAVMEQTPKYMRRAKLPIVKAKIGPQIVTLISDAAIFDTIPVKKEVKATISGLYITSVKGIRGKLETPPAKKQSKFKKWVSDLQEKAGAKPLK